MTTHPVSTTGPPLFPAADAQWIITNVIGTRQAKAHGPTLTRCACQWGPCGHCQAGNYSRCANPRTGHKTNETWITNRQGYVTQAETRVYLADRICRSMCPEPPLPPVEQLDLF